MVTSSNTFVTTLAVDPVTPATLYAATSSGMFKSTDGAATWGSFHAGLANYLVNSLAIDPVTPAILYAGTNDGGVFATQQKPVLAINYASGKPGSYFTITGSRYPPDSTATLAINGNVLGTVPTDALGGFVFTLQTNPTTEEGYYKVTATVNPSAMAQFSLDAGGALRSQAGSATLFVVPDQIAYHHFVHLPLTVR